MIAISVSSSASVFLSVILSTKEQICVTNSLWQLNMFLKNLQSDVCAKIEVIFILCLLSLNIGHFCDEMILGQKGHVISLN